MDNWMQDMVWTSVGTWMDMCLVLVFKGWNTRANGYGQGYGQGWHLVKMESPLW